MASPFPIPFTSAEVGTYFVGQYYQVLQQQPDYVHQFYGDGSTMLRIDGNTRDTATSMLQIHALIMSLSFSGIEIKTVHSLESWNGGVLIMVSGSVQVKDFSGKRKFVQTFFLAPQEKGYFVLNDIFHFIDDEPVHQHPAVFLAQTNLNSKLNASPTIPEPVSNYLMGGEIQASDYVAPVDVKQNGPVDNYSFPEQRLQQVLEAESILEDNSSVELNGLHQNTVHTVHDHLPASVDEPVGEPPKHTYASILRVAKGQSAPSVAPQASVSKNTPPALDWDFSPQPTTQQATLSNAHERSGNDVVEEVSAVEDEEEIKSVYVRNLSPNVSESEIMGEFKKFGELSSEGVVIRSRKDVGVCYAFVEFEDLSGVQNAVQAGSAQVAGRQVYIEERRRNSNIPSRGGRRVRGRARYLTDAHAPRGRFGTRSYGRGGGYDGGDREYNRLRGNGFYRTTSCLDRGYSGQ